MPKSTKEKVDTKKKKTTINTNTKDKKATIKKQVKKTSNNITKKEVKKASTNNTKKEVENSKNKTSKTMPKNKFLTEYYDLPISYNKTVVKLLAQTPETLFVYWELSNNDIEKYKNEFGDNFFETTIPILLIHNVTMDYKFEVEINDFANCWYIHVNDSKCNYEIELARKYKSQNNNNKYIFISKSNNLETPNDHILFEQNLSFVKFKNIKTNKIRNISINPNVYKNNIYNDVYTDYELR